MNNIIGWLAIPVLLVSLYYLYNGQISIGVGLFIGSIMMALKSASND